MASFTDDLEFVNVAAAGMTHKLHMPMLPTPFGVKLTPGTILPITGTYYITGVDPPVHIQVGPGTNSYNLHASVLMPADAIFVLDKVQAVLKTALQLAAAAAILSCEQLGTIDAVLEDPAFRVELKAHIRKMLLANPEITQQLDLAKKLRSQAAGELL